MMAFTNVQYILIMVSFSYKINDSSDICMSLYEPVMLDIIKNLAKNDQPIRGTRNVNFIDKTGSNTCHQSNGHNCLKPFYFQKMVPAKRLTIPRLYPQ
jgi:hypothetical protein